MIRAKEHISMLDNYSSIRSLNLKEGMDGHLFASALALGYVLHWLFSAMWIAAITVENILPNIQQKTVLVVVVGGVRKSTCEHLLCEYVLWL